MRGFTAGIVVLTLLAACQATPAVSGFSLVGASGATGRAGATGASGQSGRDGAPGPQGLAGTPGTSLAPITIGAPAVSMHTILPTAIRCGVAGDPDSTVLASTSIPEPTGSGAMFVSYQIVSSDGANYQTRLTYDINDTSTLWQQGHSAVSMGAGSGIIQMNQFAGTYARGGSLILHQDCAAGLQDTHTVTGNMVVMYWAD